MIWLGKLAPRSVVGTAGFTRYARPSGRPLFKKRAVAQDSCAILVNRLRNKRCLLLNLRILRGGTDKQKSLHKGGFFIYLVGTAGFEPATTTPPV